MKSTKQMKATILSSLIGSFLLLGLASCNNNTTTVVPDVDQAVTVVNAQIEAAMLPMPTDDASVRPIVSNVSSNGQYIAGGSSFLNVNYSDPQNDAVRILIGVDGKEGYYVHNVDQTLNSQAITVLIDPSQIQDAIVLIFVAEDAAGNFSEYYLVPLKKVNAGSGNLQVTLAWDNDNDLDLHLVQPNAEEIWFSNPVSTEMGELDIDSNVGCETMGATTRVENITYPDGASIVLAGDYIVRVDFYSECDPNAVGQSTNFSVSTYLQGVLIATTSGTNPATSSFATGTSDSGQAGSGVEVMTFNVPQQIGKKANEEILIFDFGYTERMREMANNPKVIK